MKSVSRAGTFMVGLVLGVAGLVMVALLQGHHNSATKTTPTKLTSLKTTSTTDPDVAKRVYAEAKDSVAYISATQAQGQATGSGFVVSDDSKTIPHEHVVDGAQQVTVKLGTSDTELPAQVLAADASKDLALLQVDANGKSLHPLTLGDSSKVQVGQTVFAIGNPYGLDHTFTSGIVSALNRELQSPDGTPIEGAIQTDAAINPGNSGGALLDENGNVIGVNSQIASANSSGGESGNVGIGFAIPSNTVRSVADQLVSGQKVAHAYLGVSLEDAASGGARIATVTSGSPAAHAGLKAGDVVTALDGHSIANAEELTAAVVSKQPGDTVKITVKRDGSTKTLTATLGTRPSS
jgi:putative serine protease PepD